MKLLALLRQPGCPVMNPPVIRHYPSSAIIVNGKPFFVPGFGDRWEARPGVALRICRLGKSIESRFASRYYDAVAPVINFVPVDFEHRPELGGLLTAIDSTVAMGPWQPLPESGTPWELDGFGTRITLPPSHVNADEAVAVLSRYAMMQMGDAVMPFTLPLGITAGQDTEVSFSLNGSDPFTVRIK